MTDREKAIVMARTGVCMLTGDKFQIFHKYIEDLMGFPIWTHEIGMLADRIKEKSKADFIAVCEDDSDSEKQNEWIPVNEGLPDAQECGDKDFSDWVQITINLGKDTPPCVGEAYYCFSEQKWYAERFVIGEVIAWMPLPEPYKAESEE